MGVIEVKGKQVNLGFVMKSKLRCFSIVLALLTGAPAALAQPTLGIAPRGNQILLFWPSSVTNYVLQCATDLTSSNWLYVSNASPVTVGNTVSVTITNSSLARFFRLYSSFNAAANSASYSNDVAFFYGDSITLGYALANPSQRFSTLLCNQLSMVEVNWGVGGSQIADSGESDVVTANNSIFDSCVSVWLAGYNDMRYYGTNAAALDDNQAALESLTAWTALPTSQLKPWPQVTFDTNWGNRSDVLGGVAFSTSAGAQATFNFTGTTLLIGTARVDNGGNATVVVDGTVTNIYSCLRTSAATGHGRTYSAGLIIFTNLPDTAHTVVFTAQSADTTFLDWYAAYTTNQLPKVVLCGTLKMLTTGINVGDGYTNYSPQAASLYSGMVSNVAVTLSAAKLNVRWVPAPSLNSNDWENDLVHPNESGHLKIKNAIQAGF